MTNQEIIQNLQAAQAILEWEYPMELSAAIDKAIEAVGRQIAKPLKNAPHKVSRRIEPSKYPDWAIIDRYYCPNCGWYKGSLDLFEDLTEYCRNCGQNLRKSDE